MPPSPARPRPRFFLIRHGETDWNREGRLQGQRDIPLNGVGRDQAAASGRSLKRVLDASRLPDPDRLRFIASPLGRARRTMELMRGAMRLTPATYSVDARLLELSFGAWEGLTWSEIKARAPQAVRDRKKAKWSFVPPGGESYAMLCQRVRPWVDELQPDDVVVAHGGVARVLMRVLAGASVEEAPDLDIWQGRILMFEGGGCRWI